jgi:hypothetical protein
MRSFLVLTFGLALAVPAMGCSVGEGDSSTSASELNTLHEPQGEERKAIFAAFRTKLDKDFHGQRVFFNSTNPKGRFLAHGDYAYFEGVLEGPDGNRTPIDYANSEYAKDFKDDFLAGTKIEGNLAVKFSGVAKKNADGTWAIANRVINDFTDLAYNVGASWEPWRGWASLPPPAERDIFVAFPVDDVHEPVGAERDALLGVMKAKLTADMHGQVIAFNAEEPKGTFLSHDNWAFFSGVMEGPNGNRTPLDYQNSVYATQSTTTAFKGILRNGNFAASLRVLLHKEKDGNWLIVTAPTQPGYKVGADGWVGDPESDWAWDIFGESGNGNGNGNGNGEGDGDGDGDGG